MNIFQRLLNCTDGIGIFHVAKEAAKEGKRLQAENDQWKNLRKYALHREGCNKTNLHDPVSCDCGLAQILNSLGDPHYQPLSKGANKK